MSRLPRCFYVGFQGLEHSCVGLQISSQVAPLGLSLGLINVGLPSRAEPRVLSLPQQPTRYSVPLWAVFD